MPFFSPFDNHGFAGVPFLFQVIPLIVFGGFALIIGSVIYRWAVNQSSPVNEVPVQVVAKRQHFSGGGGAMHQHHHTYTSYYVTFQCDSGERLELPVGGVNYGTLVEGDTGMLNYQGTRFNSFQRDPSRMVPR